MILIINRAFIIVLLLSISGFVFSSIYLSLEKLAYRLTSAKFMVFINTMALFSFVVPLYYVGSIFDKSEMYFINYDVVVFSNNEIYNGTIFGGIDYLELIGYADDIWLIGMTVFLLINIIRYVLLITTVRKKSFYLNNEIWLERFEKIRIESQMNNVSLLCSTYAGTPFTTGIRRKYIVIPAIMINMFDDEEVDFILRHEFYHVLRKDLPRKIMIIVFNCLNWFNPLFYLLKDNLSNWIEMACDEVVTKDFGEEQKDKYSKLILKVLEIENSLKQKMPYCVCFGENDIKNFKRRILNIMKRNEKKGIYGKVLVSSIAVLSMVSGNVVAKAADGPVNKVFSKNISVMDSADVEIISDTDIESFTCDSYDFDTVDSSMEGFAEFSMQETADTTYEIIYSGSYKIGNLSGTVEPNHVHTIVDVVIKEHKKQSDGSCITTYYEGKQCTGCGLTWKGDVIRTVTETKCPH